QIQFAKDRPVGYSRDGLLAVNPGTDQIHKSFAAVKNELYKTGAVISVAEGDVNPTQTAGSTSAIEWKEKDPNLSVDFQQNGVSVDYGKTAGWQFKEGRDFSKDYLTDSSAVVVNESAIKFMGMKNPVGQNITYYGHPFKIIGVISNIIVDSPYGQVKPCIYFFNKDAAGTVLLRINPQMSAGKAIESIQQVFKHFNPEQPFQYSFVD
ncbi:MAG TPA: ABC transporter permease, partial [Mucilaginibacter sp.]